MTEQAISPLRRRMIEDMTIRKLAPKTQHDYVQRVKDFAAFLSRSPATANKEDVRRYQLARRKLRGCWRRRRASSTRPR
jgi:integrase/recombinase XerD